MRYLLVLLALCLPSLAYGVELRNGCACNLTGLCDCGPACACESFVGTQQPPDVYARLKAVEDSVAGLKKDVSDLRAGLSDIKSLLRSIDGKLNQSSAGFPGVPVAAANSPTATVYYSSFGVPFADPASAACASMAAGACGSANGACGSAGGATVVYQHAVCLDVGVESGVLCANASAAVVFA